jgi:hypothetical protein
MSNRTWEVIDRPYGCKPIGCKWVFKKKLRPDGTIERYKARLVAKGYTQKENENFFDTYSPIVRLTIIRVLISLVASYGLTIHQMDVKTTFLKGELEEEIYMDQPDSFIANGQEGKVCKLLKWLRDLLMDLPVVKKPISAISMNCDNQTVITKINSSKDNMKSTRHVKRRLKSVRKLRNSRVIALDYVHTSNNLAYQFTKGLSRNVIESASREMGMRPT